MDDLMSLIFLRYQHCCVSGSVSLAAKFRIFIRLGARIQSLSISESDLEPFQPKSRIWITIIVGARIWSLSISESDLEPFQLESRIQITILVGARIQSYYFQSRILNHFNLKVGS